MPEADWEPRPDQEPPLLWGPKLVVEGYYELEKQERNQRLHVICEHDDAVAIWYRAMTLFREAVLGTWTLSGAAGSDERACEGLQMQLLGLSVSSMKASLDALQSGYYSVAFAMIRHMLETFVQCLYARFEPDEVRHWYEQPGGINAQTDPPGMKEMCQKLQANTAVKGTPLHGLLDDVYAQWRLMSKGSHPSGVGIRQTSTEDEVRHSIGGNYHRDLCLAGFDVGFFAVVRLLPLTLMLVRPEARTQAPEWEHLHGMVVDWRTKHEAELRTVEGVAPTPVTVPAPSEKEVRRCYDLIHARQEAMNRMVAPA